MNANAIFNLSDEELQKLEKVRKYKHMKSVEQEANIAGDALLHCPWFNNEEVCKICSVKNCSLRKARDD